MKILKRVALEVCSSFSALRPSKDALLYIKQPYQGIDLFIAAKINGHEIQYHLKACDLTNDIQKRLFEGRVVDDQDFGEFTIPLENLLKAARSAKSQFLSIDLIPGKLNRRVGTISYDLLSGAEIVEPFDPTSQLRIESRVKMVKAGKKIPDPLSEKDFTPEHWDFKDVSYLWIQKLAEGMKFASPDETRYVLNGIRLSPDDIIASDGRRLVQYAVGAPVREGSIYRVNSWVGSSHTSGFYEWQVAQKDDKIALRCGQFTLISPLIDGEYPSTDHCIPEELHWFDFDPEIMAGALKGFPIPKSSQNYKLEVDFKAMSVRVKLGLSRTIPVFISEVDSVKWKEPDLRSCSVHPQFLHDALSLRPGMIAFSKPEKDREEAITGPLVLKDSGVATSILMPMRSVRS